MLDFLGAIASLLSTYYFIRLNSYAWIISIFATCLNSWLYWQKGIYADMMLEFFYFVTTCYGWLLWNKAKTFQRKIIKLSPHQWLTLALSTLVLFSVILISLSWFTSSTVVTLDALTTSLSIAAQWLMGHKIIATWVLWFFTDGIYAYLYAQKHIPFHAALMLIYTGMAIIGYCHWTKKRECQRLAYRL
ncbi:MAG: nicotinamide riboside transporter PnuC [Legionella sp.]|nr:nicotinamide riboside transporter PnuC [Legionella sp.]